MQFSSGIVMILLFFSCVRRGKIQILKYLIIFTYTIIEFNKEYDFKRKSGASIGYLETLFGN